MEITLSSVALSLALVSAVSWAWGVLNWVWLKPRRLERRLRQQGLSGNPYRLFHGDLKDMSAMKHEAASTPISLCDDIRPRVVPFLHHSIQKHGKKCFVWMGPEAKVNIMEPKLIREVFSNHDVFRKPDTHPISRLFISGLVVSEGRRWLKHRKIINPAFHLDKLKNMLGAVHLSCEEMLRGWEQLLDTESDGPREVDVWPCLESLTGDVISRAAFGSSFEEGGRIFQLLKEQSATFLQLVQSTYIPGWRFVPTRSNRKMRKIYDEVNDIIRGIIRKRARAAEAGEAQSHDLLAYLMEGIGDGKGMSLDDVIAECKLFYFAGQETTRNLLAWTIVLLCGHPKWQARARDEVLRVFGKNKPDFDGLSQLKIVGMILNEVLRLYPPGVEIGRTVNEETKLGKLSLPKGVLISVPILLLHRDPAIWGDDAGDFDPERFSDGVASATRSQPAAFVPFGSGPRVCIGQGFATIEAKVALAMILQRFSFELSPAYAHAPFGGVTLLPQHGAQVVLRKI